MSATGAIAPRTVIEALLPAAGPVGLDVVYRAAEAVGLSAATLRLAVHRMVASEEIVQTGRGRRGEIALTDAGRRRLRRDRRAVELAVAQDRGLAPWTGNWQLIAVSVPESQRAVRDVLRRELLDAGAAAVSTGLYLTPHDLADEIEVHDQALLVWASAPTINVRGVNDPLQIAELLWPGGEIVAAYERVDRGLPSADDMARADLPELLGTTFRLAESLDHAMRVDPLVPLELRPTPWPPSQIRRRWLAAWRGINERLPRDIRLYDAWLDQDPRGGT